MSCLWDLPMTKARSSSRVSAFPTGERHQLTHSRTVGAKLQHASGCMDAYRKPSTGRLGGLIGRRAKYREIGKSDWAHILRSCGNRVPTL